MASQVRLNCSLFIVVVAFCLAGAMGEAQVTAEVTGLELDGVYGQTLEEGSLAGKPRAGPARMRSAAWHSGVVLSATRRRGLPIPGRVCEICARLDIIAAHWAWMLPPALWADPVRPWARALR